VRRIQKILLLAIILGLFCLLGTSSLMAWGYCDKSFIFMGMTIGDTCTLAFMEVAFGECERWNVYYIYLDSSGLIGQSVRGFQFTAEVPVWDSLLTGKKLAWARRFWPAGDHYEIKYNPKYSVKEPLFDSAFNEMWRNLEYDMDKTSIIKSHFDEPIFNMPVELLWRWPDALYKNYRIDEAILVGRYVFIRTHQPLIEGRWSASLHGVMVYRLK